MTGVRFGLGAGLAVTELEGRDKADNEHYGTMHVEVRHSLNDNFHFGVYVKGVMLRVHTHRTDYGSHIEKLSNGQDVEVIDEFNRPESINLNSAIFGVSAVWKF